MVSECKEKTICKSKVQQRMGKPMDKLPAPDPFSSSGLSANWESKSSGLSLSFKKGEEDIIWARRALYREDVAKERGFPSWVKRLEKLITDADDANAKISTVLEWIAQIYLPYLPIFDGDGDDGGDGDGDDDEVCTEDCEGQPCEPPWRGTALLLIIRWNHYWGWGSSRWQWSWQR